LTSRQYEGMFLFDSGFAADLSKAEGEIKRILDRAGAEMVFCRKWDERRLAYDINGCRRGTYVLTYFMCPREGIVRIEHDAQLSESVLRVLVLRAENVTAEHMNEFAPERKVEVPPAEAPPTEAPAAEAPSTEAPPAQDQEPKNGQEPKVPDVAAVGVPDNEEPLEEESREEDVAPVASSAEDTGEVAEP